MNELGAGTSSNLSDSPSELLVIVSQRPYDIQHLRVDNSNVACTDGGPRGVGATVGGVVRISGFGPQNRCLSTSLTCGYHLHLPTDHSLAQHG